MPNVERSPFTDTPNDRFRASLDARRSMTPGDEASMTHGSNPRFRDGDAGGSGSLTRSASPVDPPNNDGTFRFKVADAKMPQPPSVTEPGPGAVPVDVRTYSPMTAADARRDTAKGTR